jgi:hypothetical protein
MVSVTSGTRPTNPSDCFSPWVYAVALSSAKLRQLETERAADANTLVALRYEVQELTAKLGDETQSLDRECELLGGRT